MKQINLTIKIPALPVTIGLVAILALTLFTGVLSTSAETLNRPSADNPDGSGVITGCVGSSTPTGPGLIMAGRVITPSNLVSLNPTGTCGANETAISWNVQGPKGDKGDKGDPTYVQTVVVSPVGSDTANGTALLAAVAQIAAANPTYDKGYLIKLEPGNYNLGDNSLTLPLYVNLEGSGLTVTSVYSTAGSSGSLTNATIVMSGSNQVKDLYISNNGSSEFNAGVLIKGGYSGGGLNINTLSNSVVFAVGSGGGEFYGVASSGQNVFIDNNIIDIENNSELTPSSRKNFGISNTGSMTIQDSTIITQYGNSSIAVRSSDATTTIQNSSLTANYGFSISRALSITSGSNSQNQVTVQNSVLTANKYNETTALYNANGTGSISTIVQNSTLEATGTTFNGATLDAIYNLGTLKVGASEISGNVNNTGSLACAASYDGNFVTVGSLCV